MTDESQIQITPKDAPVALSTAGNNLIARGRREAAVLIAKGLEYFLKLCEDAERGDADAQFSVGLAYCFGLEVLEDYASGVAWYCVATKEGRVSATAQKIFDSARENGGQLKQDEEEAAKWLRIAAANGNADARHALGLN
jgi:TPR repeat protein